MSESLGFHEAADAKLKLARSVIAVVQDRAKELGLDENQQIDAITICRASLIDCYRSTGGIEAGLRAGVS